jgi:DNA helicase-2/ATP-dependent DNA helicase PcrA
MTIHKSKGLDFPVVLIPQVTADEWAPSSRAYDALETGLSDDPGKPFAEDFMERDARETRRVFHVGITRAEDILVLQGGREEDDDTAGDTHPMTDTVSDILPSRIPWQPERGNLPLWADIQECLPAAAVDWTDTLAVETIGEIGGTVSHDGEALAVEAARNRVLALATASLDGELTTDEERSTLHVESLTGPPAPAPSFSHS